jgi:uncharacterized protein (UPF0548 family)
MFLLRKPSDEQVRRVLAAQAAAPFTYRAVGASRGTPPPGWAVRHTRAVLGRGAEVFGRARAAVRRWEMFRQGWLECIPPEAPLSIGTTVGVLARHPGFWSLNVCRIVYLVDEVGAVERFGFAYGTLPAHAAAGEERFLVEWSHEDDAVTYDVCSFSRPRHLLARVGLPVTRLLQRRFAAGSVRAMVRAVGGGGLTVAGRARATRPGR